ncbi:CDP-alcohol phosphatidyltransferase family protein [Tessaracoccus antarcticus]|uniref:CDP-alcohol phosphatidyltransferase family protein n=1 Tax=Tessaracoccus antarcticus TaxID=2479848 RepID=A0A3M0GSN3_9ACTN|nr:CDP-alcohol phosphatidyltransferase family protein [Tessaracoccus antarcticus]
MTVPNVLSFIRLLAVGVFGWLILAGQDVAAVVLLVLSGVTDWLDGFLARRLKQRTELGAKLDPVADRLYILMAIIALTVRGIVPWWLLAVLLARDVMLLALVPSLRRSGIVALPVNYVGKAATMCLLLAIPLILLASSPTLHVMFAGWVGWPLGVLGAGLYWWAGAIYLHQTVALSRKRRSGADAAT